MQRGTKLVPRFLFFAVIFQADNNQEPWPGLLSGGPNQHRQDPAMKKLATLPPAKMYLDDWESYATNENAINWNAAMVFLLAGVLPER